MGGLITQRLIAQRLLPVLQLTRMALVFTAIADTAAALLLWARWRVGPGVSVMHAIDWPHVIALGITSSALYGFGMSLNDIIDRRRDEQVAAYRPLPSGRIGVATAHVICAALALIALAAGTYFAATSPAGWRSLLLLIGTGAMITFYDYAGKYLVPLGLLTLGMIRFFHSAIAAPGLPLVWHPLLLMNHVALLSMLCYAWEEKRPPLTAAHVRAVLAGLLVSDAGVLGLLAWARRRQPIDQALWITPDLLYPLATIVLFGAVLLWARRRGATARSAGQTAMLYGLLWLIVYDAAFVAGYVGIVQGLAILSLLPVAYLCVQLMRWWGRIITLSQRPEFRRPAEPG